MEKSNKVVINGEELIIRREPSTQDLVLEINDTIIAGFSVEKPELRVRRSDVKIETLKLAFDLLTDILKELTGDRASFMFAMGQCMMTVNGQVESLKTSQWTTFKLNHGIKKG